MTKILTIYIQKHIRFCYRHCAIPRKHVSSMSSGTPHLQRTAGSSRREVLSDATVEKISDLSPTVKKLVLCVHDRDFTFSAGQWVDFFAPQVSRVGGFSMCSSPYKLQCQGLLDLAVKYSTQQPAYWVHTQCKVGSKVQVRVGGDFHYDVTSHRSRDLLLIAGGVGINPLLSVLHTVCAPHGASDGNQRQAKVVLLYSAKNSQELIFKGDIETVCRENTNVKSQFHITGEQPDPHLADQATNPVIYSRINEEALRETVREHFQDKEKLVCFLCGPGQMIDDMEQALIQQGLSKDCIHFEKWW